TPLRGMQLGAPDLSTVSTSGVERIEVVEGGGSTLFGSGAIGGVINIITAPRRNTRVDLRTGSFATNDLRIDLPYLSFERYVAGNAYALPNGTTQANADVERTTIRSDFAHRFGKIAARFNLGITSQHLGVPGNYGNYTPTSRQDTVDSYLHGRFAYRRAQSESIAQVAASTDALAYTSCIGAGCQTVSRYASTSLNLRNIVHAANADLLYGIDLSRGTSLIDNTPSGIAAPSVSQSALYVQEHWFSGKSNSYYVGLRGERDGSAGNSLSPAIGGRFALGGDTMLRANLATAFRAPTIFELYFPCPVAFPCSNPNLQPERARVADLTLSNDRVLGGTALTFFDTRASNLIVYAPPLFIPENVDQASLQGLTLTAKTRRLHGIGVNLSVTDLYRALDLTTNARIYGRGPVLSSRLTLDYLAGDATAPGLRSWGVTASTAGLRNDPADEIYYDVNGNPQPNPPFAQAVGYTDLSAYVRFRIARRATITLRGENLGNERYALVSGYPMPGRSFSIEFSTR
ncbi:MAG: TonB-dependent receptor plug domain-containing protein, partial [Candidatus Baltobacteraceae bacterium]